MNTTFYSASVDLEDSRFSRWSYQISDIRSDPALHQTPSRQISRPSPPSPPPQSTQPPPLEIEDGVWHQDDDILFASNWPPVQAYLAEVREKGQLVNAPSDIIFTLAALDVLNHPDDRAHWIFWSPNQYEKTGNRVTTIAAHRPRLIKSKVSWLGTTSYRWVLHAIQQKFEYVHVRKQWYPVDHLHTDSRKRTLRSSSGTTETPTVSQFFSLDTISPKKAVKKKKQTTVIIADVKRTKKPVVQSQPPTTPVEEISPAMAEQITEDSASPTRSSTRVRRKVTPTSRSPRIITAPTDNSDSNMTPDLAAPSSPPSLPPPAPSSHSRSTSQSSMKTIVESERSVSVLSSDTVVETLPSKKRKADDMEKADDLPEDQEQASSETEGMVTRGRASKICSVDVEKDLVSSRTSTPAIESPVKTPTRPRTRVKRARV